MCVMEGLRQVEKVILMTIGIFPYFYNLEPNRVCTALFFCTASSGLFTFLIGSRSVHLFSWFSFPILLSVGLCH